VVTNDINAAIWTPVAGVDEHNNSITAWWCNVPILKKKQSSMGRMTSSHIMENNPNVPNHQTCSSGLKNPRTRSNFGQFFPGMDAHSMF